MATSSKQNNFKEQNFQDANLKTPAHLLDKKITAVTLEKLIRHNNANLKGDMVKKLMANYSVDQKREQYSALLRNDLSKTNKKGDNFVNKKYDTILSTPEKQLVKKPKISKPTVKVVVTKPIVQEQPVVKATPKIAKPKKVTPAINKPVKPKVVKTKPVEIKVDLRPTFNVEQKLEPVVKKEPIVKTTPVVEKFNKVAFLNTLVEKEWSGRIDPTTGPEYYPTKRRSNKFADFMKRLFGVFKLHSLFNNKHKWNKNK
ncbi:hypothetical protein SSYRP_v1c05250 [Spiroplasma syrphidicola EA-1]|uniref:Uncharacterized protein n=1 Tax=Spiroplasma syrphidicola EA-1 TaxID=1276229 RepID=R4UIZ1_9MOLU|nr:hypothetical protein [Spiroplasma syrphidicola]AGM26115.1 hypothetical protein SSYRP_v1c05250 [Spiroplasma syrphidicola EA-1]